METKINSETAFFTLNGQEFEVKKVEAKSSVWFNEEQDNFFDHKFKLPVKYRFATMCNFHGFYISIENLKLQNEWEQFLISEARKRGFVSGCHFSDGLKIIYMPSGRMKLLTLSKLVTDCRNPTVIYDNGKWCEVIKKEAKSKEADEVMANECRKLIGDLTDQIRSKYPFISLTRNQAAVVRDILNEKLNEKP